MNEEFFAMVGQYRATTLDVLAGQGGPWYIDTILDDSHADLTGRVTVTVGSQRFVGTIQPAYSGSFALQRSLRVVAGAGGWGNILRQKAYHDDNGVTALTVASDAARECGETLGTFDPPATSLGRDYVRRLGTGSAVLDRIAGDRQWWVDQAGVTHIGSRPSRTPDVTRYQVDKYSPLNRLATISLDDPALLWVGDVLASDRLSEPQTIRDIHVRVEASSFRVFAYTGGDSSDDGRLVRAVDAILDQREQAHIWGKHRFRVYSMAPDGRANLQAVRKVSGLPDVLPVVLKPGAPGLWGKLTQGSEVLVEFIGGDPAEPIVTGFAAKGEPGHCPELLEIGVTDGDGAPAARMGDSGVAYFPPEIPVAGTMTLNGATVPFVALATIVTPAPVQLTTGSAVVSIGGGG